MWFKMCFEILFAGPIPLGCPTQNLSSNSGELLADLSVRLVSSRRFPYTRVRFFL